MWCKVLNEVIRREEPEVRGYVVYPDKALRAPGLILLHSYNQDPNDIEPYARKLASRGLVVIVPRYTNLADGVVECEKAYGILSRLSQVDPEKIGAMGFSLGGTVALMSSLKLRLRFIVDCGGWVDLEDLYNYLKNFEAGSPQRIIADTVEYTLGSPSEAPDLYRKSSPISYVDMIRVPTLIIHGGKDDFVPVSHSQRLYNELVKRGVRVRLRIIEDAGYLLKGFEDEVVREVLDFLSSEGLI